LPGGAAYMVYLYLKDVSREHFLVFISVIFFLACSLLYVTRSRPTFSLRMKETNTSVHEYSALWKLESADVLRNQVSKILISWGGIYGDFLSSMKGSPLDKLFMIIDFREKIVSRNISQEWRGFLPNPALFEGLPSLNRKILQKMRWTNKIEDFAEEIRDYWLETSLRIDKNQIVPMIFIDNPEEREKVIDLIMKDELHPHYEEYSKIRGSITRESKEFLDESKPHDALSFFGLSLIHETLWMLEDCPLIIGKDSKIKYYGDFSRGVGLISKGLRENKLEFMAKGAAELMKVVKNLENLVEEIESPKNGT
jgi:hypothetical protein